ncbi:DUF1328 domain-containing protein [Alkalisalibacterium limincola]|uniref:UPF0391 membrane protein FU658_08110 n=1 Tax=Alkalisalibacterium limincola TaxID=2699169 RepID=A0A5C8KRU6_9GAMM|nr:DUF1328 domain-containing protein [Alkalisalibacterium limincola]TXK62210.1 DUF1328 domain-containing protein [Alkalisalibacterium limincola]
MLKLALFFLIVALLAGLFGFTDIAGASMMIAKVIFFIAIAIFVLFLVLVALGINFFTS